MRIGEFANSVDTSIDTIRYYMELGLIVPERQGTYFYFDERCKRDYDRVIELKDMGFSLTEIKNMLMILRFSKMASEMEIDHYRSFFKMKHRRLIDKREQLEEQISAISDRINLLNKEHIERTHSIGVGIDFLPMLRCKSCNKPLSLNKGSIEDNQLVSGTLTCECGYNLSIEDGIIVDEASMKRIQNFDEGYFVKFIEQNNANYLTNIYQAMEWGYRSLMENEPALYGNVVELGVGNGIFLSHIIKSLPKGTRYIAIDYDLNRLRYIKKMIERTSYGADIVFICCDFTQIPLKEKSFNFLIDFYGTSSYQLNYSEFLLKLIKEYYADDCGLLAIFMSIDSFKKNSRVSDASKRMFKKKAIIEAVKGLGFKAKLEYSALYERSKKEQEDDEFYGYANKIVNYGFYGNYDKK